MATTISLTTPASPVLALWTLVSDNVGPVRSASASPDRVLPRDAYRTAERGMARALSRPPPFKSARPERLDEIMRLVTTLPAQDDLIATLNLAKFGIHLALETGQAAAEAHLRGLAGAVHYLMGHSARAVLYADQVLSLARKHQLMHDEIKGQVLLSVALSELGETTEAQGRRERAIERTGTYRLPGLAGLISAAVACSLFREGRSAASRPFIDYALLQCASDRVAPWHAPIFHGAAVIYGDPENWSPALSHLERAAAVLTVFPSKRHLAELGLTHLEIEAQQGRFADVTARAQWVTDRLNRFQVRNLALAAAELAFTAALDSMDPRALKQAISRVTRIRSSVQNEKLFQQRWLVKKVRTLISAQEEITRLRQQVLDTELRNFDRVLTGSHKTVQAENLRSVNGDAGLGDQNAHSIAA